jgi:hypothetical protein
MFRWYDLISIESLMKDVKFECLQRDIVHTNPGLRVHQNLHLGHFASNEPRNMSVMQIFDATIHALAEARIMIILNNHQVR